MEEWRRANQRLAQLQADHAVQGEVVAVAQHALAHAQQAAADAVERQQQQEQETEQLRDEPQLMAPNLEPGPGPQTLIALLPTRTLAAHEVGRLSDSSQRCSVCLGDMEVGNVVKTLPCLHIYHDACIDRWLQRNPFCPVCLTDLADAQQAVLWLLQQDQETEQLRDEPQLMAPNLEPGPGPQTLIDLLPTRTLAAHEVGRLPDSSQRCSVCLEDID